MDILIKNAEIICETSAYHGKVTDIRISNGTITDIGENLPAGKSTIIEGNRLHCTIGLCDIGTHCGEPGFEHRETIQSLAESAFAGGYTHLFTFPNNKPVTQSRADILFLEEQGAVHGIRISPIGALSKDCKGEDIAEYLDMLSVGVRHFSDGMRSSCGSGLLKRAFQYAKGFDGVIIHHPIDTQLAHHGEMHEGSVSTGLGMTGVPVVAETSILFRDILLTEYTGSRLIAHSISSADAIQLLQEKKSERSDVKATIPYLNLIFTDEALNDFDSNLKVTPVLRAESDRLSLIKALKSDVVGALISNHTPLEEELKKVEFPYATPGATGLETCLPACITYLKDHADIPSIVHKLTISPRKLMDVSVPSIEKGAKAELCIFDSDIDYIYTSEDNKSLSVNNPFFGKTFKARVVATINGTYNYIAD